MPTYQFRNKETGEEQEVVLRMSFLDQWKLDNPDWEQFFSGTLSISWGGRRDIISRTPDGFKDLLNTVKKGSGRANTIRTK